MLLLKIRIILQRWHLWKSVKMENGNFSFARKPGADTQLKKEELDQTLISGCRSFSFLDHYSLTNEPAEKVQRSKQ